MKLIYSLTSPYARKVRIALVEKNIPFALGVQILSTVTHRTFGECSRVLSCESRKELDRCVRGQYNPAPPLVAKLSTELHNAFA